MIFTYKALDEKGAKTQGTIDAVSQDLAIGSLQRRGLVVVTIKAEEEKGFRRKYFQSIKAKDVVIISRQISTLFEAQVSALKAFSLLATNVENKLLQKKLNQIVDDLQAGQSISGALGKHPDTF